MLVATLIALGVRMRLKLLLVSATAESHGFWLRQGCTRRRTARPPSARMLRTVDQAAVRRSFANSLSMAMLLPLAAEPVVERAVERVRSGTSAAAAAAAAGGGGGGGKVARQLTSAEAPAVLGYDDVNSFGNFFLRNGERVAVNYAKHEQLAVNVPYSKLLAFWTGGARGWGVRCAAPITKGHVVVEVRGRCLTEAEYEQLADPSYVVSFDDKLLALKRAAADDVMYLDLREQGNMMRLINDCQEAPNLQLMYWPELDVARGVLPRRAFLVAKHDVPAGVELTWNYGRHYERHWLAARNGTGSGWSTANRGGGTSTAAAVEAAARRKIGRARRRANRKRRRRRRRARARSPRHVTSWWRPRSCYRGRRCVRAGGARRYDWLRRVHAAAEPAELGATIEELESAVRGWALGDGWPAARDGWQARVEALQRGGATAAADELAAVLRPLLSALQPALAGERAEARPRRLRSRNRSQSRSRPSPRRRRRASRSRRSRSSRRWSTTTATTTATARRPIPSWSRRSRRTLAQRATTRARRRARRRGARRRRHRGADGGRRAERGLWRQAAHEHAERDGVPRVKRKGGGYILAENVEAGTFATAVEAAVAYAKGERSAAPHGPRRRRRWAAWWRRGRDGSRRRARSTRWLRARWFRSAGSAG